MSKISAKKIKVGESYFFPNTDFTYTPLFRVKVTKERINKIIDGEFSTRNEGDKYEQQRYTGFTTEDEAKKYLIKQIKERLKDIEAEAKMSIDLLSPTTTKK